MKKYVCVICGYVYDEKTGDTEDVAPGTTWDEVPHDWVCPICGAEKTDFREQADTDSYVSVSDPVTEHEDLRKLTAGELSALFSNLSKGCIKQYKPEEGELFNRLSEYYEKKVSDEDSARIEDISSLVEDDINDLYPSGKRVAVAEKDRGALRALTWGDKATRIGNTVLQRYQKQKEALLDGGLEIYLCEICGFIYIGRESPAVCPVCSVPALKIRKV